MPLSEEFRLFKNHGRPNHLGLTIRSSQSSKTLAWDSVFGATDYVVEVGTSSGASNFLNTAIGSTTPSYTLTGLTPGTTYYARVRSVAAFGGSGTANAGPASDEISFIA